MYWLATLRRSVAAGTGANQCGNSSIKLGVLGVLAVYLLFFHRLAERDLWSSHEARAGMDAQTILEDGAWGLPHLYDGRPELQKPPLYYWLVAALGWLRGGEVDAWAVRLPAAGAALLSVVAVFAGLTWGRRRAAAGVLAALGLATALHFTWLARIGRIDMPLTLCVTLALGSFYLASEQPSRVRLPLLLLAYLAVAAGVLLKGPIGFVLPAAVLIAFRLTARGERRGGFGLWWGVPLVAALTLPWFLWVNAHTHGEFFRVFFWHHNIERGLGGSGLRSNPWWFYLPQFFADYLPWSPLLIPAVWWMVRRGYWRSDAEARFGLIWFLTVLLLLSCSRFKRADYLLPAYPGAAIFLGCIGQRWLEELDAKRRQFARAGLAALAGVMVVLWLVRVEWQLPAQEPYRDYRAFAGHIRRLTPQPNEVIFFRTEAHPLAFHVGRPLAIVVQWEELQARLLQPGTHYVVTPPSCAEVCARNLPGVQLENLVGNTDLSDRGHEHPLLLLRACPASGVASAPRMASGVASAPREDRATH